MAKKDVHRTARVVVSGKDQNLVQSLGRGKQPLRLFHWLKLTVIATTTDEIAWLSSQ